MDLETKDPNMHTLRTRIPVIHLKSRLLRQVGIMVRKFSEKYRHIQFENIDLFPFVLKSFFKATRLYQRGYHNFQNIQITHNHISINNLPGRFQNFKILHISDLHLDIDPIITPRIIQRLKGLKFDLCVMTGDYRFKTSGLLHKSITDLKKIAPYLSCEHGIYAVLGNHDFIEMVPYIVSG